MALTSCPECGGSVSTQAAACPHCGAPVAVPSAKQASPKKPGKRKRWGLRFLSIILIFGFVVALLANLSPDSDTSRENRASGSSSIDVELAEYWQENQEAVLTDVKRLIGEQKYGDAIARGKSFMSVSDSAELKTLVAQAEKANLIIQARRVPSTDTEKNLEIYSRLAALEPENQAHKDKLALYQSRLQQEQDARAEAQRRNRISEIEKKLRGIPGSNHAENARLYRELVALAPDENRYQNRLDHYQNKIDQAEKERAARRLAFGEAPIQSGWDGSYRVVEEYLNRIANDPDSIEIDGCTSVYHTKDGWLVGCDYRGRNAFGGMIRQSNWFTIVHGQVREMHDASAFSP